MKTLAEIAKEVIKEEEVRRENQKTYNTLSQKMSDELDELIKYFEN